MKPDAFPYIIEPLRSFAVDLSTLTVDPNNTRKHDARSIDGVKRSLQKFGQRLPIIVQKQGLLVRVGNGRVLAARQLGWTHIAALVVDESEADALQYAIADNRTGELSDWDYESLANQLKSLSSALTNFNYTDLGWDEFDVGAIMDSIGETLSSSVGGPAGTSDGLGEDSLPSSAVSVPVVVGTGSKTAESYLIIMFTSPAQQQAFLEAHATERKNGKAFDLNRRNYKMSDFPDLIPAGVVVEEDDDLLSEEEEL